jgi:hypothetical protein
MRNSYRKPLLPYPIQMHATSTDFLLLFYPQYTSMSIYVRSHCRENRLVLASCPFFFLPVRLSLCISASPAGRISMKFYNGGLYENLSRNPKFVSNRVKIPDPLLEDLGTFIVAGCFNRHKIAVFDLNGIKQSGQPRWYKPYAHAAH